MRAADNILLLACALLISAWTASALAAGTAQAAFSVQLNLSKVSAAGVTLGNGTTTASPPADYCTSMALGQTSGALVRVVCGSNQFVDISLAPGANFSAGTHGGAYRFILQPGAAMSQDDPLWHVGLGTVTSVRILHKDGQDEIVEMLISF